MSKGKEDLKKQFWFIVGRCFFLYFVVAVIISISVDRKTIAKKTMDYLKDQPVYMLSLAEKKTEANDRKLKDSIRYYRNLLILLPESGIAHSVIGYSYYKMRKFDQAIHYYEKAIQHEPDLFGLNFNLGVIHYQKGNYQKAVEFLAKGLDSPIQKTRIYPWHVDPYRTYGGPRTRPRQLRGGHLKCFELLALSQRALKQTKDLKQKSADKDSKDVILLNELYYYPPFRVININNKKQMVLM